MQKTQLLKDFIKNPNVILTLILLAFFMKGVFLATLFPIFTGQDEARHYNSVQFLNEPKEKTWEINNRVSYKIKKRILETYNFSTEIQKTGAAAQISEIKSTRDKMSFAEGYLGRNESEIDSKQWLPYNQQYPPEVVKSLYAQLAVMIEKIFSSQSILVRFFAIRIFSVLLGTLAVWLAYLIALNIGFQPKESLVMAAILAFQSKFSIYTTNINYDALIIPVFTLFALGAVLFLKHGPNWKNITLLLGSLAIGIFTKGTALVLIGPLFALAGFYIYKKFREKKIGWSRIAGIILLAALVSGLFFAKYNLSILAPSAKNEVPLTEFISKGLSRLDGTSQNYWGSIDWVREDYSNIFVRIIWIMEALAAAGLLWFFISKNRPSYLPEKKYIIFLLLIILALQFGVRFHNWRVTATGSESLIATPGRYFLPNLAIHIILMFTGIGMLFHKKKVYFDAALLFGLVLTFSFSMHVIFNIILPRFYL